MECMDEQERFINGALSRELATIAVEAVLESDE